MKLTEPKLLVVLLLLLTGSSFAAVAQERLIMLRGRVVDANTGEAMANVRVVAKLTDKTTITDGNSAFTLELPPGPQELYITTVNYGLVKKDQRGYGGQCCRNRLERRCCRADRTHPPILSFADVQGKLLYDFSARNQIGVSAIYGSFDYDRNRD